MLLFRSDIDFVFLSWVIQLPFSGITERLLCRLNIGQGKWKGYSNVDTGHFFWAIVRDVCVCGGVGAEGDEPFVVQSRQLFMGNDQIE